MRRDHAAAQHPLPSPAATQARHLPLPLGRTPQRRAGRGPAALPARRRLLPSPRTATRPGCGGAGRSVPTAPCPPGAAPAHGARGCASRRGEARREEEEEEKEKQEEAQAAPALLPPPAPRFVHGSGRAAARTDASPGKQHRPPRRGECGERSRRGAAPARIPLLCASSPCGHSQKGLGPLPGRQPRRRGRYQLHPLLGPARAPSPPRCQVRRPAEASRKERSSGQGGTRAGAAGPGSGWRGGGAAGAVWGHRGSALRGAERSGGQRARPAQPADSAESSLKGGGSVVRSPECYRVPETNQTDNNILV